MPRQTDLHFAFEPASGAVFDVIAFHFSEGLSELFRLEMELSSDDPAIDFSSLLDQPALFTIRRHGVPVRFVHGLVTAFSQGQTGFRRTRYHALVEPMLIHAGLRSDWRIFQALDVPAILNRMINKQGISGYEQRQTLSHEVREYCVQADETDHAFIDRLAAEEGFLYAFHHTADNHTLIHTDCIQTLGDTAPVLYHAMSGGDQAGPVLWSFSYRERVCTTQQTQRDYTFRNPRYGQQHVSGTGDYERYDYPGRYKRDESGKPFTRHRLLGLRGDACVAQAEGDDASLMPGFSFQLTGHPRSDLNRAWRPVRIEHHGRQHTSQEEESATAEQGTHYRMQAALIPANVAWKAPPLPKPCLGGPQMAQVVGPPGEEIFCDEWGRIKIQFPWDRQGQYDEHSSCWVRVAQNWAGSAWGHMAVPRIGQEVIVDFLDGDPDQPIVTGRTYHAVNPPPYKLPANKTVMTIKSRTHKGDGFNELRFEDERDREEIYVHAQKDQNIHVNHDETTYVGHDRTEVVDNDERITIHGHRTESVDKAERITIHGDRTEEVDGKESISIHKSRKKEVDLNETDRIGLLWNTLVGVGRTDSIGVFDMLNIGVAYSQNVGLRMNTLVGSVQSSQIGKSKSIDVGERYSLTVGGGSSGSAKAAVNDGRKNFVAASAESLPDSGNTGDSKLSVDGQTILLDAQTIQLTGRQEIILQCGDHSIRLNNDGIEVMSRLIKLNN